MCTFFIVVEWHVKNNLSLICIFVNKKVANLIHVRICLHMFVYLHVLFKNMIMCVIIMLIPTDVHCIIFYLIFIDN